MKNNDLISRQALLEAYDREHEGAPGKARRLIEDAPAVDAVEVVRCSRCVYGMDGGYFCILKQNPRIYPDSFCSEGINAEYEAKEAGDEVCEECMIRYNDNAK